MNKTAAIPNIVPGALLRVIDDTGDTPQWKTLAEIAYTPRHINQALKKHNLSSAWVHWVGGKEIWYVGPQIAHK